MKFVAAIVASLLMLNCAYADNHSEPNYSKFQSNFYFTCPQPAACVSAFEKMLASPDIAEKNFEVSLMALSHNGWDESPCRCGEGVGRRAAGACRGDQIVKHVDRDGVGVRCLFEP